MDDPVGDGRSGGMEHRLQGSPGMTIAGSQFWTAPVLQLALALEGSGHVVSKSVYSRRSRFFSHSMAFRETFVVILSATVPLLGQGGTEGDGEPFQAPSDVYITHHLRKELNPHWKPTLTFQGVT